MLISRTPLRISLGGGGTDLPSYYSRGGGFVVAAAIDRYVYIAINRTFTEDYFLKYSALERAKAVEEIEHPIIRHALELHPVGPALELVTVGLLRALHGFKREPVTPGDLAEEAAHIELDLLREPAGKQDQYIASYGGLTCFEFRPEGSVHVSPLSISTATLHDLDEHLLMFFTGYSRSASKLLGDQRTRTEADDGAMVANLDRIKEIGIETCRVLEAGDTTAYGELMHEHWLHKRERSPGMSNEELNRWYDAGIEHGALGGKLVGAGGGGFLLFYTRERARLREAMRSEGLTEVRFSFDHDGSMLIVRD